MAESKHWIVTTNGERSLADVKKELTATGFEVAQVLDEIGCITGTARDSVAEKSRSISGVADVSPDEPIDIGPPDAPVTW